MAVNDLLPGLDFSWGVVVDSLSPKAEVKPSLEDALYLKKVLFLLKSSSFSLIVCVLVVGKLFQTDSLNSSVHTPTVSVCLIL